MMTENNANLIAERIDNAGVQLAAIKSELSRFIVGHKDAINELLTALLAGGHVLIEGVPGIGKTKLIQTLAEISGLEFRRIQFTPDLMPGDITGSEMLDTTDGKNNLRFERGPVFSNIVLADEINRATPKTQAALLEAMQERVVSVGLKRHKLDEPFFVLATQNPIEMSGTYPLPEAQLDRFIVKINFGMPTSSDLAEIISLTTTENEPSPKIVTSRDDIIEMQNLCREIPLATEVRIGIAKIVHSTHPESPTATDSVKKYVRSGASPRAAQAIALLAKARALSMGKSYVGFTDVASVAFGALNHRVVLGLEAYAEDIDARKLTQELTDKYCK